jgi:hypothetical protein
VHNVTGELIWELSWLKEHDVFGIGLFVVGIDSLVEWGEILLVEAS